MLVSNFCLFSSIPVISSTATYLLSGCKALLAILSCSYLKEIQQDDSGSLGISETILFSKPSTGQR